MEPASPIPRQAKSERITHFVLALAANRICVAALFFAISFAARLYFVWTHPELNSIFAVRGVPYSDSSMWVWGGIKLAHGEGFGTVYRPGLSSLLALFFVWFGTSFQIITWLNIFVGAFTAGLIYLVGERVFTRGIATTAALFFVLDPSQLVQMPQATTEPLGLMLFAGSVYCALCAGECKGLRLSFLSGSLLALSNLTRPLTLLCAPFYALYVGVNEWLRARKLSMAILFAAMFCFGTGLTMAPWLVRQKLVYGVGAAATNMAEGLYAATSPKYKTWKYTVQTEADRAGIAPTVGARYRYFMTESLRNIQRYPRFYAGQVTRAYWNFLNSFSYAARIDSQAFEYNQWSGLIEGQILFVFVLAGFLFVLAIRAWIRSGRIFGVTFAWAAVALLAVWHWAPLQSGAAIILVGSIVSLWRCQRRGVVLLILSLAISGLGDAIFNNAIFYRAVMMTDWIVSMFYLAFFSLLAEMASYLLISRFGRYNPGPELSVANSEDATVASLAKMLKAGFVALTVGVGIFAAIGCIRIVAINFGISRGANVPRLHLSIEDKAEIIKELRLAKPASKAILPDPADENLLFTDTQSKFRSGPSKLSGVGQRAKTRPLKKGGPGSPLVVFQDRVSPFLYYFPAETEFEERNRLFKRRRYGCTILLTSRGRVVFPGKIPNQLKEKSVVYVGWVEGMHPDGERYGEVMQCIAVIPILNKTEKLDYAHAVLVKPRTELL